MTRIAVIEDDLPTSNQLAGWIRSARSGIVIDQWFTRDEAEATWARARRCGWCRPCRPPSTAAS
jgi:hypothetical protein